MGHPLRERSNLVPLWLTIEPETRRRIEQAAEQLIALLDIIDGDPDLEPALGWPEEGPDACVRHGLTDEEEPSLGWPEVQRWGAPLSWRAHATNDNHHDCEIDEDEEDDLDPDANETDEE
ncbi:hypothetical protein GWI72_00995 [Microvirga tunisiensis]|uniref:Uncharacterized protein n=1 Tax=Pannonibacter tanglangensis TaxID=2750084 RepID=A0A7X5F1P1_9HYPH|nr:hypothetical protein [Pannonibacter sp. XCT-53]NBN76839.1 hypothetical protein [Pannonibacter sp. XCT-53]